MANNIIGCKGQTKEVDLLYYQQMIFKLIFFQCIHYYCYKLLLINTLPVIWLSLGMFIWWSTSDWKLPFSMTSFNLLGTPKHGGTQSMFGSKTFT